MVVLNVVMITLGQVIAYAIDQAFYDVPHGWRWMVGLGAVPAGAQFGFLFSLPESRKCELRELYRRKRVTDVPSSSSDSDSQGKIGRRQTGLGKDIPVCNSWAGGPQGNVDIPIWIF